MTTPDTLDTLDDVSTRLAAHADAIRMLGKQTIHNIIEIGRHLTEARDDVGHGNWLFWLSREFSWSDRTARNFMRVYRLSLCRLPFQQQHLKSENVSDLDISTSALYLLARPSMPDEVREEIFQRAETGEQITVAAVKEAVEPSAPVLKPTKDSKKRRKPSYIPAADDGDPNADTDLVDQIVDQFMKLSLVGKVRCVIRLDQIMRMPGLMDEWVAGRKRKARPRQKQPNIEQYIELKEGERSGPVVASNTTTSRKVTPDAP
jgi:hypothetical protein